MGEGGLPAAQASTVVLGEQVRAQHQGPGRGRGRGRVEVRQLQDAALQSTVCQVPHLRGRAGQRGQHQPQGPPAVGQEPQACGECQEHGQGQGQAAEGAAQPPPGQVQASGSSRCHRSPSPPRRGQWGRRVHGPGPDGGQREHPELGQDYSAPRGDPLARAVGVLRGGRGRQEAAQGGRGRA
eukprot:9976143-Alexandrium_andersonii.AAC.1